MKILVATKLPQILKSIATATKLPQLTEQLWHQYLPGCGSCDALFASMMHFSTKISDMYLQDTHFVIQNHHLKSGLRTC